jgi:hypothetical protein
VIDPHWLLEDLDPKTWRAIGRFFMPSQYIMAAQPDERGLFILHDGGQHPKVVDSALGPRTDVPLAGLSNPRRLAEDLRADGEWDRVHVIDRRHLAHVAREAQSSARRDLTLDEYYHLVYQLIWDGSDGYVCAPPHPGHWHGWTYGRLREWAARLPSPCSVGLCVLEGHDVHIGLVLGFNDGRIVRVTTFEGLPPLSVTPAVSDRFADDLWQALGAVGPPAALLVATRERFEALVAAPDRWPGDGAILRVTQGRA